MTDTIFDYRELIESGEELIQLSQACKEFNPPISDPTSWRYVCDGVRGKKLKTVKVGARRFTTRAAIHEFKIAQLENPAPSNDEPVSDIPKRSTKRTGGMTQEEISAGLARHGLDK